MENMTKLSYLIVDYSAIPREYMMVDHEAIKRAVRELGENAEIPGVRPYRAGIVSHLVAEAREMVYAARVVLSIAQRLYGELSELEREQQCKACSSDSVDERKS